MSRRTSSSGRLSQSSRQGGWAPNLTPRAAVRIAALGGIVVAMLGLLLVRLWFLQVISGEDYAARAQGNHLRTVVVEAPRGNILDRNGVVLVANVAGKSIVARPSELRGDNRARILGRLAKRLTEADASAPVTGADLIATVEAAEKAGQPTAMLAENVSPEAIRYMAERWRDYPGVGLENSWVRTYPQGDTAAHILGSTGKISEASLKAYKAKGYQGNEVVGVDGLELQYEDNLRGIPGRLVYEVDASGEPRGQAQGDSLLPRQGRDVKTTIDIKVERALQSALAEYARGASGRAAGVAIDPRNGEVLGMASVPTFRPQVFVDRREKPLERLYNDPDTPLLNRATQGTYPAGSTFKVVTAAAALRQGVITPSTTIESEPVITLYDQEFQNFRQEQHGWIALPTALEVSSDTFFYRIGDKFYQRTDSPLQEEARNFGFGARTGIDLPSESTGIVPDPAWKKQEYKGSQYTDLQRGWAPGDTIQLAVGQGFFTATPLQLAVAYAAIANGGTVRTPSLGLQLLEPNGRVVQRLSQGKPSHPLDVSSDGLAAIREGLYMAANGNEGTSAAVFSRLPEGMKVAGKTGTAETGLGTPDHSWFVGYAPADNPRIVVAVVVENAGTGSNAAAPAVCRTMSAALSFPVDDCGIAGAEAN